MQSQELSVSALKGWTSELAVGSTGAEARRYHRGQNQMQVARVRSLEHNHQSSWLLNLFKEWISAMAVADAEERRLLPSSHHG